MATTAATGRKAAPPKLRLIAGRGNGKDSAGRDLPVTPNFGRGLPVKPEHLSPDADWLWDQVIEQMREHEILKPLDAASLEVVCETFARWREAVRWRREHALMVPGREGVKVAPYIAIEERASKDFRSWCAEYGLTPAAENKLDGGSGGEEGEYNPFA